MNREEKLEKVLLEFGIPHHIKGYTFIKQGLIMIMNDKSYRKNVYSRLYGDIAMNNDTTPSGVERGIRHALEKAFENPSTAEAFAKYFGNSIDTRKGIVSNKHFLVTLADYILD